MLALTKERKAAIKHIHEKQAALYDLEVEQATNKVQVAMDQAISKNKEEFKVAVEGAKQFYDGHKEVAYDSKDKRHYW